MQAVVPCSLDSQIAQTNYCSTLNIPRIYRSSYIGRNPAYLNIPTIYRGARTQDTTIYRFFSNLPQIYREQSSSNSLSLICIFLNLPPHAYIKTKCWICTSIPVMNALPPLMTNATTVWSNTMLVYLFMIIFIIYKAKTTNCKATIALLPYKYNIFLPLRPL